jgi:hypothetical protein
VRLLTFADCQCWTPLIPEDIKTDRTVRVDVRVVDLGCELDLGRLERVVGREVEVPRGEYCTVSIRYSIGMISGRCLRLSTESG